MAPKEIKWNYLKNERLRRTRGVSFEQIIDTELVGVMRHPGRVGQNIMLFKYRDQIWIVPYIEEPDYLFLKTLYPSRKYTRIYKRGELK